MSVLLEVCVDSPQGLRNAVEGGAGRVELCAALDVGGLTPSPGLMTLAGRTAIPVHAMIRPRSGDFVYGGDDEAVMLADIDMARRAGLAGVVIGASLDDGGLDLALMARLVRHASGLSITLHRAFDLVPDALAALEQAVALGVTRILTSGQEHRAVDAADLLKTLVDRAAGRITILPGSGITPENVGALVKQTGVREVHASCRGPGRPTSEAVQGFGFAGAGAQETSLAVVRRMRAALDRLSAS